MPGRPMREYLVVPAPILGSDARLEEWLGKAAAYTRSLPPKPPKPTRGKKKT